MIRVLVRSGEIQEPPKAFHVVVRLHELIVQCGVGDRSQMEYAHRTFSSPNCFSPIERREILRDEITAIAGQILEIAGTEIVDHGQTRVGKFLL